MDRTFLEHRPFRSSVFLWLIIAISIQSAFSKPVQVSVKSRIVRSSHMFEDSQVEYLTKFGYLPEQSDFGANNLRTADQLHDALRKLQAFGNIPVTGQLDADTRKLMQRPRCGLPDILPVDRHRTKRYTLHGRNWSHVDLTWSLRTRHFERMDIGRVRANLYKALEVWSKHSKLTFREVNSESADILVFFEKGKHGDDYPFDGPGQVLAHAFFPGSGRGGDAHFDEDEEWLLDGKENPDGTNLFTVAAHEFGHSLGLAHSSVEGALMYPYYQVLEADFELPLDDRYAIQILYGSAGGRKWADIPTRQQTSPKYPAEQYPTTSATPTATVRKPSPPRWPEYVPVSPRRPEHVPATPRRPDAPTKRPAPQAVDDKPDYCNTSFDAVSAIRSETFFFKDKYMWRFGQDKKLLAGYPALTNQLWKSLPNDMTRVDAVYEKFADQTIVFFVGRFYYAFDGHTLKYGYPKPLTTLGLPDDLDHVDAVAVWSHNSQTYIFSGSVYWKYDEEAGRVEPDYPRDISTWKGVGHNVDTVFQWHDHATYFFKNRGFWKFNDLRMSVEQKEPKSIGRFWFNCSGTGDRQSTSNRNSVQVSAKGARGGRMQSEVQGDNNDAHAGRAHSQSWSLSLVAAAFLAVFLRAFP